MLLSEKPAQRSAAFWGYICDPTRSSRSYHYSLRHFRRNSYFTIQQGL